jgi:large subunit ribosomal protein L29
VKLDEIRGKATEDLHKMVRDSREELFKLRYAQISEAVENTAARRELRKRVARIHTILRERQLAAAASGEGK